MQAVFRSGLCAAMILLGACSPKSETASHKEAAEQAEKTPSVAGEKAEKAEKGESSDEAGERGKAVAGEGEVEAKEDFVALSEQQIKAAGIEVMPIRQSFAGAVEAPAVIAADPKHAAVVSSSVGGRVVEIRRNLGDPVARGDVLAVIESRDVAQLRPMSKSPSGSTSWPRLPSSAKNVCTAKRSLHVRNSKSRVMLPWKREPVYAWPSSSSLLQEQQVGRSSIA